MCARTFFPVLLAKDARQHGNVETDTDMVYLYFRERVKVPDRGTVFESAVDLEETYLVKTKSEASKKREDVLFPQ